MSDTAKFFKAPRYLLRKYNILHLIEKRHDIKTILDVGCGAGELACTLAQRGYTVTGIDFSRKSIAVANDIKKQRGLSDKQVSFHYGDLNKLKRQSFDLVICCEVIEHIKDDNAMLKRLAGIGKYYVVSVPARQAWFDEFDAKVGHYRRYEKAGLQRLLRKHGYAILDFRAYGYPYINITRRIRQAMAGRVKHADNIKQRTQASGTNAIRLKRLQRLNIEPVMRLLFYTTLPFNRFNLSEGYLVFCRRK